MDLTAGVVLRHAAFYVNADTGELEPKFLLVLAAPPKDDIVYRLLTSRHAGLRPRDPPCHHGPPYPGFFIGVPAAPLGKPTWVDLRPCDDYDRWAFARDAADGVVKAVMQLDGALLRAAMACAAGSDDATRRQAKHIRDALASLPG